MYEICKHVNFMFQFGIIIDYLFTFQKILFFFSKYPVFGYLPKPRVNTQKIFTNPLGIYPPHITNHEPLGLQGVSEITEEKERGEMNAKFFKSYGSQGLPIWCYRK